MATPTLHRGKLARAPRVLGVRALTREDMLTLRDPRPPQGRPRAMRETHHRLARLVAAGVPVGEILSRTGYSSTRLLQLRASPAFQELVTQYKAKVDEAFVEAVDEFYSTATSNMLRMERMVEDHLDEAEETQERIPLSLLFKGIGDRADRFGYGKKTTQKNEIFDFAAIMEQYGRSTGRSNVIDAKANYRTLPEPVRTESPPLARLVPSGPSGDDGGENG